MPAKSLKVDSLELDLENPRITLATDQRDAMQKIITEQKVQLVNLAENIAAKGLNPMNRFLVMRSGRAGKFIVLEGNRRILAIKILKNPHLLVSLQMTDALRKRFQAAAKNFDIKKVEPLDCHEVADRAEGNEWIRQRHMGRDAGRGIVDWTSIASSRFRGRDPALQALDFVLEHAGLTDEQKEQITGKFPLTTLDRLLSTPSVRAEIGFEVEKGKLTTELPAEEAIKPLKRIVLDLSEKKVTVTDLKLVKQQDDYIAKMKAADRPNLKMKTGTRAAIESITDKDFKPVAAPSSRRAKAARPAARTHIVPKGCRLNVTVPKIAGIYGELTSLLLSKHVHAIGVLLRVFLEMSVDAYLVNTAGLLLTFNEPRSGRDVDKKLKMKVEEAIDHMVNNGADDKDFKGVRTAMCDVHNPFSIETLHAYIHNRFFTPVDTHLTTAWDNSQPLFERIWP
jgi:hypothetical protein